MDESYFGARRIKGRRGRGAYGKTIVFGLLKREGKVYTEIVPDVKAATLQAVIRGKVDIDSIVHTDGWRSYDGLVDIGYDKHFRVHHGKNEFVRGKSHINPKSRNRNSQPPEIIKIYHHNSISCQKAVSTSMNMP
jgi:transposase-like protein